MESGAVEPAKGPAKVVMVKPGDGTGVGGGAARAAAGSRSAKAKHRARAERWEMNGSKGERVLGAMIESCCVDDDNQMARQRDTPMTGTAAILARTMARMRRQIGRRRVNAASAVFPYRSNTIDKQRFFAKLLLAGGYLRDTGGRAFFA
jgi:hypothetical protein